MPTTEYGVDQFFQNSGTSPKMVYDVAGTLGWSPHNLCLQSQTFDNPAPAWGKSNSTITANAIASPDGTMTADALIPNAGNISPFVNQPLTVPNGTVVTFSVYAKNGVLTPWLFILSDVPAYFNLATGVKGSTTGISSNMVAAGNGWYRCDVTFTAASATPQVYLAMTTADGAAANCTTGDGVKVGFYLWGAQMNRGSIPLAYLPTTTAARFGLAVDYDPVTHAALGLLREPAATNVLLQSQTFDNASWGKSQTTVTANAAVAPDGTTTADKLVEDSTNNVHNMGQNPSTITGTFSVFAKAAERSQLLLYDFSSVKGGAFNLSAGTVITPPVTAVVGATIQSVGNGWYRCSIPVTSTSGVQLYLMNGGTHGYLGNGTSGLYIWGAQIETGTVATSYIPTLAATVTRVVDQYNVTPASIGNNATTGSWWAEVYPLAAAPAGNYSRIIGCTPSSAFPLGFSSAPQFTFYDGTVLLDTVGVTGLVGNVHKVASAFQAGSQGLAADGLTAIAGAGTSAFLLDPGTNIWFGSGVSGGNPMLGYIRKVRYLPRRPTNAELATMTA
jgi:hypothetical protein